MYLREGIHSSKLKSKSLILKASGKVFTDSTVERIQLYQYWSVIPSELQ